MDILTGSWKTEATSLRPLVLLCIMFCFLSLAKFRLWGRKSSPTHTDDDKAVHVTTDETDAVATEKVDGTAEGITDCTAITYRKAPFTEKSHIFFTGYSLAPYQKRADNAKVSPIYQLPTELHITIMEYLDPVDIYLLRHSYSMFLSIFAHKSFSRLQRPVFETPSWKDEHSARQTKGGRLALSDRQYSSNHLHHRERTLSRNSDSICEHTPIVEMDRNQLSLDQISELQHRIRQDFICKGCLAAQTPPPLERDCQMFKSSSRPPPTHRFCMQCDIEHRATLFSEIQVSAERQKCIGWEGKVRTCPHRHVSLSDTFTWKNTESFESPCRDCQPSFLLERGERCPTLSSLGEMYFRLEWTIEVCPLTKGQVVTKALLRQGLRDLETRFGNEYLCPHVTFTGQQLTMPFDWEHCICFREPTEKPQQCYQHTSEDYRNEPCCACNSLKRPEAAGTFMSLDATDHYIFSGHRFRCSKCWASYEWKVCANRITLTRRQCIADLETVRASQDTKVARLHLTKSMMCMWVRCLDSTTYHGNEHMEYHKSCVDEACWKFF